MVSPILEGSLSVVNRCMKAKADGVSLKVHTVRRKWTEGRTFERMTYSLCI